MSGVAGWRQAWCLREKRARKRRARETDSETRALRRARISGGREQSSSIADGAIVEIWSSRAGLQWSRQLGTYDFDMTSSLKIIIFQEKAWWVNSRSKSRYGSKVR